MKFRRPLAQSWFCTLPLAAAVLSLATGCERRRSVERIDIPPPPTPRHEPELAPVAQAPAPAPPPPPLLYPPLRRAAAGSSPAAPVFTPVPSVPASPALTLSQRIQEDGRINIRVILTAAAADERAALLKLLEHDLKFRCENPSDERCVWSRAVATNELNSFATELQKLLATAGRALERERRLIQSAALPARLLYAGDKTAPRELAYTGHPLDVALADDAEVPSLFIAALDEQRRKLYVRGGRIYIADDGSVRLENVRPDGEWLRLPAGVEHVLVRDDGRVIAMGRDGFPLELGRFQVVKLSASTRADNVVGAQADDPVYAVVPARGGDVTSVDSREGESPLRPGHLEFISPAAVSNVLAPARHWAQILALREMQNLLVRPQAELPRPVPPKSGEVAPQRSNGPLTIHADLPWTEKHLKALGVKVDRTPGRTTISPDDDPRRLIPSLIKVLEVLRQRMALHEQNFRNAERIRDAENRLNPYRRRILKLSEQGEPLEELDPAPLPRISKPGDPNADAEGFVQTPNVNRAVEAAEFQAAAEEYRLVRTALERLAPEHIFPDPITLPAAPPKPAPAAATPETQ